MNTQTVLLIVVALFGLMFFMNNNGGGMAAGSGTTTVNGDVTTFARLPRKYRGRRVRNIRGRLKII